MEMTGEQRIPASQEAVWAALNNPAILKACIPGCESIERQSDDKYRITMLATVGPVKARFNGTLAIRDAQPPHGYALAFEGSGGAAGFGKGGASVTLKPAGDGTQLAYVANAEVSGKLAQVGSRLIDGVAKKIAAEFFLRFKATFSSPGAASPASPPVERTATAGQSPAVHIGATAPAAGRDLCRELRTWQAIAVTAIAVACLAIGYIAGTS